MDNDLRGGKKLHSDHSIRIQTNKNGKQGYHSGEKAEFPIRFRLHITRHQHHNKETDSTVQKREQREKDSITETLISDNTRN